MPGGMLTLNKDMVWRRRKTTPLPQRGDVCTQATLTLRICGAKCLFLTNPARKLESCLFSSVDGCFGLSGQYKGRIGARFNSGKVRQLL